MPSTKYYMKFKIVVAIFFVFAFKQIIHAQSLSVMSKNFNSADYSENAEFRCAVDDENGTTYFGTNYGVLVYKGEKKSGKKNWEYILLPEADIINALYFDKSNSRLYVGAQNTFGYFQISPYGNHQFFSIKTRLPKNYEAQTEIWHINKINNQIIFHSISALFVFKNEQVEIKTAPIDFIFHNVFALKNDLLINSLNNSWYAYNEGLKKITTDLPCNDKCYAVLPADKKDTYWFIYRNIGVYRATYKQGNISNVLKVSDNLMDAFLAEQQVYCATTSLNDKYIVLGTLNDGAYIFKKNSEFKYNESLICDLKKQTDISSVYSLYKNSLGNIWVLGKTNLSVLPTDFNFVYNEFNGTTVNSMVQFKNDLLVSTSKGVYKITNPVDFRSLPQLINERNYRKLVLINDTVYGYNKNNLIVFYGKDFSEFELNEEIIGIEKFNGKPIVVTSSQIYEGVINFKNESAVFSKPEFELLTNACVVKDKLYLSTTSSFPIIALNKNYQLENKYSFDTIFTSINHIKLFNYNQSLLLTNTENSFTIKNNRIVSYNDGSEKIWFYKKIGDEEIKMDIDANNYNIVLAKLKNKDEYVHANLFYTNIEINDVEKINSSYFIGDKSNLIITNLYDANRKPNELLVYNFRSLNKDYNLDSTINIPYEANNEIKVNCGLYSFYASFPNTEYFYCLKGLDDKWRSQFVSEISFNNLSWGDYELQIKANYGNLLSTPVKTIKFSIQKPWYITWWAILLWVFLVVLIIYMIVQISIYRLKQSKIKLEAIVQERTYEVVQQKNEIESQKEVILHKNIEITDSINYAKRIQTALLKDEESIQAILPNAFVLYMPKDIVSGDFYWFNRINDTVIVAIADCTGHGVPGAFMSMLGVAKLNELAAKNYSMPDVILKELNKLIVETLGQNIEKADSRDGMDIGVIAYNRTSGKLYYAGANRSLSIVNNSDKMLHEIKATKIPVGGSQYGYERSYELHEIEIQTNITVYLTTDGYADQFGGPKGKKFMTKNLAHLFVKNAGLSANEQYQLFKSAYQQWKGEYEQVDDVCIFGVNF